VPRRKAIDYPGVRERLESVYTETESVAETGAALGLSAKTVRKYLKELGFELVPGRKPGKRYPGAKRSPVHVYLSETNEPLPRSVREAARRIGVSRHAVNGYMRRRRERYRAYLESVSPLNRYSFIITDQRGHRLPLRALSTYTITDILPNGRAVLEGRLPTGNRIVARFRVSALAIHLKDTRPDSSERT
jgi:signal recognition particle subunit SEC65